ncbi:MAG: elongation factor Ts [Dehalococcoidia bacterium]|nr:elongation factor Ts [Dehalococcoidia bacterium]
MPVSAADVKTVRERTGAGFADCRATLDKLGGNVEKAVEDLRQKGIAKGLALADKKASAKASQGMVDSYIHAGGRIGVLLELNCETDFVARTEEFRALAHNLAMQVAAMSPRYIGIDDLPEKPEGALADISLMHQAFIRDPSKTIKDLVAEAIGKLGESIRVRRFSRYELGG